MIEFRIKEKTRSLNESFRGDWRPRAAAAKRQRTKAMQACPKWPGGPLLVVRITRVSPGTLDGDALPAALKHVRDGVASRLKIDDASPLVEWQYHQAKGEAEVVVQIWKIGEDVPPLPMGRLAESLSPPYTVKGKLKPSANYAPPTKEQQRVAILGVMDRAEARSLKAAQEAEETFAPGPSGQCGCRLGVLCGLHRGDL